MDFLNLIFRASFLFNDAYFKKDPTHKSPCLSIRKLINTVYEKYIKYKKTSGEGFFEIFFRAFM